MTADPRRVRVVAAVADVLGTDPDAVVAAPSLFDLPGFDSLAIVAVLERLEDDAGVEVPPERILPEAFVSIDTLCSLIATAVPAPPAAQPTGGIR